MVKRPGSLVTIGREIEQQDKKWGRDPIDPEEMARLEHQESSTSSSSEDEIPPYFLEQFKKRQEEIDHAIAMAPKPKIMIIENGQIVGEKEQTDEE